MNSPISIIIPTLNAPAHLDLCIESIIEGQSDLNEIVVVVDGTYAINKPILDKWKDKIKLVVLETNMGISCATNTGVYHTSNDVILVVNDDNVFPSSWDRILLEDFTDDCVLTPNQIEPSISMFKQFRRMDYGKIDTFDLEKWFKSEQNWRENRVTNEGSTLPFMMKKINYMKIGGWDESFQSGHVVDWEFFLKCNLNGYAMKRTYKCNFYHFVSTTFKSPTMIEESKIKEQHAFEYFRYKWGTYPKHDPVTNLKTL